MKNAGSNNNNLSLVVLLCHKEEKLLLRNKITSIQIVNKCVPESYIDLCCINRSKGRYKLHSC